MNKTKILIAGATGFTGSHVTEEFCKYPDKYDVSIFVRDKTRIKNISLNKKTNVFIGSFEEPETLKNALQNIDVFICLASLGFGHAKTLVDMCESCGVKRTVFTSTTGIFTKLNPASKAIRVEAEKIIKNSNLNYTIVRPTMIFGTNKDRNIYRLIMYIKKWPVLPVPGSGDFLLQPIYVKDLAKAFIQITQNDKCIKQSYNISGKNAISFNNLVRIISKLLNKNIIIFHIPTIMIMPLIKLYEKLFAKPFIKAEQILRLNENKSFNHKKAIDDFGYSPISIEQALKNEIGILDK